MLTFGYLLAFVVHLRILLFGHRSASEESEQNYPKASSRRSDLGSMVSGRCSISVSEALDRVFRVQRRFPFVQYVYRRTVFYFDAVAGHFVLPNMSCRLPDQSLRIAVFDVFLSRGRRSVAIVVRYASSGSESFLRSPSKRGLIQTPSRLFRSAMVRRTSSQAKCRQGMYFPFDGNCDCSRDGDIVLTFSDGSQLKTHSMLLKMASPVFALMLTECTDAATIALEDTSPEVWLHILNHIHPAPPSLSPGLELFNDANKIVSHSLSRVPSKRNGI